MTQALSIQNLTKVYKNGIIALQGIDLTVESSRAISLRCLGQMARASRPR